MLLPDVCGVLGELPAGGAAANQRPLPLFLFRIHCCRADCGRAGRPRLPLENAPELTACQLDAAAREAILLNADTRLQSAPVQDGRVYWVEDISKINRIQAQLAEINTRLSEENELIQAENELKRQRAQIEEKIGSWTR